MVGLVYKFPPQVAVWLSIRMKAKGVDPRERSEERAERVLQAPGSERSKSVRTGVAASVRMDSREDFRGLLVSMDPSFGSKYGSVAKWPFWGPF